MTFIKHPKDFWAGVLYTAFGVTAIVIALSYPRAPPGEWDRGTSLERSVGS